jgi:hypothetical protein
MYSPTSAMHVAQLLKAHKIPSDLIRLPQGFSEKGCAYGLEVRCEEKEQILHILHVSDIRFGKWVQIE